MGNVVATNIYCLLYPGKRLPWCNVDDNDHYVFADVIKKNITLHSIGNVSGSVVGYLFYLLALLARSIAARSSIRG